jgi:lipid-A-disaccharide synthase
MKLLVSALEPSANVHLQKILKHRNDIELYGIFEKRFGNPLHDNSNNAIMGIVDALKKIRFFLNLREKMVQQAAKVDKVLLIDGSGFNLPLAKKLKKRYPNLEITYYILPQAWAWRRYRVKAIEKYCDRLFSILPFECELYSSKCRFVGHPLLDSIQTYKSNYDTDTIVFMPGSRKREITSLMPVFRQLKEKFQKNKCVLVVPEFLLHSSHYGDTSGFEITSDVQAALLEAKHAFICSGTATLEAALIGTPLTLAYIANNFDYKLARALAHVEHTGLANIIIEKEYGYMMHGEFFQEAVTAQNLYDDYAKTDAKKFQNDAVLLRKLLKHGSSDEVAKLL